MKKEMENQTGQSRPPSSTTSNVVPSDQDQLSLKGNWCRMFKIFADPLFNMDKGEWLEDMRGNLSMVAALISAITFQVALNPPGGVVQTNTEPLNTRIDCNKPVRSKPIRNLHSIGEYNICTGQAPLAVVNSDKYLFFIKCNTFSFVASLSAALLLISGIPLRHRLPMWFLSVAMSASLSTLAMTYLYGVLLVTPDHIIGAISKSFENFMLIWIGLLQFIILLITIRFLVWFVKRCRDLYKCLKKKRNSLVNSEVNVA